jgi:hypothetical protein
VRDITEALQWQSALADPLDLCCVCDFCSHGASATGRSLVDPKYSRSKQSCRFATGNRHPCGTRGIRRCAQQISGAHDFGQQYLLRCDSKCGTSVYGGSDPHRLARTISATLSDGTVDALLDEIEEFLTGIRHGAEPDRTLATIHFTDIADSTSRQQRWVTGNEVNCCSNTTSSCEGSWRGSVARRRTRRGIIS